MAHYKDAFGNLINLFKSQFLDVTNKLNKLVEIGSQMKNSKQSIINAALEKSKFTLECMESERDYVMNTFDS